MNCPKKNWVLALLAAIRHGGDSEKVASGQYSEEFKDISSNVLAYLPEISVGISQDDYYRFIKNPNIHDIVKLGFMMRVLDGISQSKSVASYYISGQFPEVDNHCPMDKCYECDCVSKCVDEILEKHRKQFVRLAGDNPGLTQMIPEHYKSSKKEQMKNNEKVLDALFNEIFRR